MKRIRFVEETIAQKYGEGKMRCPTHLSIGQEAVAAAVGLALRKDDVAVSGHRAHAHYLGKGGNLKAMIAEIYGKATGCARGKGGSMPFNSMNLTVSFFGSDGRTIIAVVIVSFRASTMVDRLMTSSIFAVSIGEKSFVELNSISAVISARPSVPTAFVRF